MSGHEAWFAEGGGKDAIDGFISHRGAKAISAILTSQRERGVSGSIVEIGTYIGKTFVGLSLAASVNENVVGIDLFDGRMSDVLVENIRKHVDLKSVSIKLKRCSSAELSVENWKDILVNPSRFVHIDGGHDFSSVLHDIYLSDSYLAETGVVVIDDFVHEWYPDVTEGIILGLRSCQNLRPVAVIPRTGSVMNGGTKLVCSTHAYSNECLELMKRTMHPEVGRVCDFAGHSTFSFFNYD